MIEKYENFERPTYVIADSHGDFNTLYSNIVKYLSDCILIIAGDVGLGFYDEEYYRKTFEELNNLMIEKHINCYLIRGNHDEPRYFKEHLINYSNIKTVDDYSIISIGDKNILCIGGAISIDRNIRIKNDEKKYNDNLGWMKLYNPYITQKEVREKTLKTYWKDEIVIYDEEKLNEILVENNIDFVITHTSPSFAWKNGLDEIKYWLDRDEALRDDLSEERENLTKVFNKLIECNREPKKWVYGHFHEHNVETFENTEFIALQNCDFSFDCYQLI
ncbi:MAG: metallophosphoesterase [Bacilli bacterium]|nr:metallophosphoesterase [Bacilli bacterium]